MKEFEGRTLSWEMKDSIIELALHREPLNEIGSSTLEELERFVAALDGLKREAHALILYSRLKGGFCAGADLRQFYGWIQEFGQSEVANHARAYVERVHAVMNAIDAVPLTTIAAVHGVTFGGGFELGADLRPDNRRQGGAILLSRVAFGADPKFRRDSAPEARSRQCCCSRPAAVNSTFDVRQRDRLHKA